jgi:hypothetical protein
VTRIELPGEGESPTEEMNALATQDGSVSSSEAEMDEVLSRIDPDTEESEQYSARSETEGIVGNQLGEEGEQKEGDEEQPAARGDDFEKAISILQRAKVPKAVIDSLGEADAIAWANEQATIQSTTDEAYRRKAELERELRGQPRR